MTATAANIATGLGRGVLRLLMPPLCVACHAPVADSDALCTSCWMKLTFIEAPVCDRLGIPFPYDQGEGAVSAAAIADPPEWGRARAAVVFDDLSRRLIHALKYHDRHEAGLVMGRLMARAGRDLIAGADALVPIPLHRSRLRHRRYNQSVVLARNIGRISGRGVRPDLLVRTRPTRRQEGLDAATRRRNVKNAFKVPAEVRAEVDGRAFVIIDDVLTTGATASAAVEALMTAGAARVDILSFALVLHPKRLHI